MSNSKPPEYPATVEDFFSDEGDSDSSGDEDDSDQQTVGATSSEAVGQTGGSRRKRKNNSHHLASLPSVDLTKNEFKKRGKELVDFIADYMEGTRERAVSHNVIPGFLFRKMSHTAPKEAGNFDSLMEDVQRYILPGIPQWMNPGHHAMLPLGASYASILGGMLCDGLGASSLTWNECPAAVELEMVVMNWLAELMDLPLDFHFFGKGTATGRRTKQTKTSHTNQHTETDGVAGTFVDDLAHVTGGDEKRSSMVSGTTARLSAVSSQNASANNIGISSQNASANNIGISSQNASANNTGVSSQNASANNIGVSSENASTNNIGINSQNASTNNIEVSSQNASANNIGVRRQNASANNNAANPTATFANTPGGGGAAMGGNNFGVGGGGIILSSTTECLMTVLAAAKRRMLEYLKEDMPEANEWQLMDGLMAYCSEQSHPGMERVCEVIGVKLKRLWTDRQGIMHCNILKSVLEKDKQKGYTPFIVVATAGTIASASVDQIDRIGPLLGEEFPHLWFHIDASYAGSAFICREYQPLLHGIGYADSINVTVHKWLPIHMDCGCLWVKKITTLTFTFGCEDPQGPLTIPPDDKNIMAEFRNWSLPMMRRFKAIKIWSVFKLYGFRKLQQKIREDVRRAKELERIMQDDHRFEIMADTMFGIVTFRCKRPDRNDINKEILAQINKSLIIKMSGAWIGNKFWLRFVVAGRYTTSEDVLFSWEMIKRATSEVTTEDTERAHNEDRCGMPNYKHVVTIGKEERLDGHNPNK